MKTRRSLGLAGTYGSARGFGLILLLTALTLFAAGPLAAADGERVMVGEDIFVGADEVLREVVCIGCSIRVEGRTEEVVAIGGNIEIAGTTQEAVAIGGSIEVTGQTGREVVAVGGNVTVSGSVGREVVAVFGNVTLLEGASVEQDVVSVGGRVRGIEHAKIGGSVQSIQPFLPAIRFGFLLMLAIFLVAGLVLQPLMAVLCHAVLGERRVWVLAETTRSRAGLSFLLGLGMVFGSFMLSIFGALNPFLAPLLSLPFWLLFFVLLVVGYTGISYWVGRSLVSTGGAMAATLLGAVLVTILQLIPILGWMAFCVFSLMAMGAALLSGAGTATDWLVKRAGVDPFARPVERT
ncbi:MAG: hypothetical protein WD733_01710 [Bryobacterales bacterium]